MACSASNSPSALTCPSTPHTTCGPSRNGSTTGRARHWNGGHRPKSLVPPCHDDQCPRCDDRSNPPHANKEPSRREARDGQMKAKIIEVWKGKGRKMHGARKA